MSDRRCITVAIEGERQALKQIAAKLYEEIAPGATIVALAMGNLIETPARGEQE